MCHRSGAGSQPWARGYSETPPGHDVLRILHPPPPPPLYFIPFPSLSHILLFCSTPNLSSITPLKSSIPFPPPPLSIPPLKPPILLYNMVSILVFTGLTHNSPALSVFGVLQYLWTLDHQGVFFFFFLRGLN